MNILSNLSDIETLETRPYRDVVTARTTTELIAQAAARFPDRDAFRFLPNADLTTPAQGVRYRDLMAHIHRAANLFVAMGVGCDEAVAIPMANEVNSLNVANAGAVFLYEATRQRGKMSGYYAAPE